MSEIKEEKENLQSESNNSDISELSAAIDSVAESSAETVVEKKKSDKNGKKNFIQFVWFIFMSIFAFVAQILIVQFGDDLLILCGVDGQTTFVAWIFGEYTVPTFVAFLTGNIVAKVLSYILNRKKTFAATNNLAFSFSVYVIMCVVLIIVETLIGPILSDAYANAIPAISGAAETISVFTYSLIDFLIVFFMEKYVIMNNKIFAKKAKAKQEAADNENNSTSDGNNLISDSNLETETDKAVTVENKIVENSTTAAADKKTVNIKDIVCRKAEKEDMSEIVKIHTECFDKYLLTQLDGGKGDLLKEYYGFYLEKENLFYTATADGKVVGFITGYYFPSDTRKQFEKKFWWKLFCRTSLLLLKFNKDIYNRLLNKVKNLFAKKDKEPISEENLKIAYILSLAVLSDYRRKGIAEKLLKEFEKELSEKNIDKYYVNVFSDNHSAISFYEKEGFTFVKEKDGSKQYRKELAKKSDAIESDKKAV